MIKVRRERHLAFTPIDFAPFEQARPGMKQNSLAKPTLVFRHSLSSGASSLGCVFHDVDLAEAIATVHAALEAGINYFDVAPAYVATR